MTSLVGDVSDAAAAAAAVATAAAAAARHTQKAST